LQCFVSLFSSQNAIIIAKICLSEIGKIWQHLTGFVYPCSGVVRVLFESPSEKQPFYRTKPEEIAKTKRSRYDWHTGKIEIL
jgi:hypothetical protein